MNIKEAQFFVARIVEGEHFTVLGRCGDMPIYIGDAFNAVYRYKHRRYPDELGDEPVREVEKPAAIRVLCIHAYQRSLQRLGGGHTASLTLEGDGIQYLAPGWVLGEKSGIFGPQIEEAAYLLRTWLGPGPEA
ncbi:MAG: hypothetical protein ACLQGP_36005 [Isosphaeraceae bacterium]